MKVIGWLFAIILLAVVGGVVYLVINSGDLAKTGIEEFGPDYLGADVKVGAVNIQLLEGSASITNLQVGNPRGFAGDYAMRLGEVAMRIDTQQTTDSLVVINELLIDGASLAAVAKGKKTNLQQLVNNVSKAVPESGGESSESEMKFIVDRFAFTNADVSLVSDLLGETDVRIPDIELKDVGRKGNGATAAALVEQLLKPITQAVGKAAVTKGLDIDGVKANVEEKVRDKISGGLKGLTDRFKK